MRSMVPAGPLRGRPTNSLDRASVAAASFPAICQAFDGGRTRARTLDPHCSAATRCNARRWRGEQTVRVEVVHVYDGGQAIVGTVEGGGGDNEKRRQSHGAGDERTLALAPRCLATTRGRDTMPEASGDRQEAVQASRRRRSQRAHDPRIAPRVITRQWPGIPAVACRNPALLPVR